MSIDRRTLIGSALATGLASRRTRAAQPDPESKPDAGWRRFKVATHVVLQGSGAAQLYVPLAQTAPGYQLAAAPEITGTGQASCVQDRRYGARLLRVVWPDQAAGPRQVDIVQRVATRDHTGSVMTTLTQAERDFWTAPTASVPTGGIVRDTALRITAGRTTQRARLRAIYDWVVDTTERDPATRGCGTGDIETMLRLGRYGGKCADINGLAVGLTRAAGLPARDVYGLRVARSALFPSLGRAGMVTGAQHCRAEVFLDDGGWFPIDPADVRKVVLEEKLPLQDPRVAALRERLFGRWEMNWIGYNSATDIDLPQSGGQKPNFPFLMYPCAFTSAGQPDCLDAARFRYDITSSEAA